MARPIPWLIPSLLQKPDDDQDQNNEQKQVDEASAATSAVAQEP